VHDERRVTMVAIWALVLLSALLVAEVAYFLVALFA
jgi:hypothetical protein